MFSVIFFFSWASIPLMYSTLKLFRDTSTAYMVLFCGSVFIGITTASCIFLLEYFSDSQVQTKTYQIHMYTYNEIIIVCEFTSPPTFNEVMECLAL